MNDANQIRAEIDEFTPRVQFLINPNDGSLCLIRDLVSPGRSMAPHSPNQHRTSNESWPLKLVCHDRSHSKRRPLEHIDNPPWLCGNGSGQALRRL